MTVESTRSINRAPRPSGLSDVLEVVLDKGIVIDAYVRVAVVGIELLTIDARIVIASVDTYLRFAEAVNRLELQPNEQVGGLPGMIEKATEGGANQKTKGALGGAKESVKESAQEFLDNVTSDSQGGSDEHDTSKASESRGSRRGSRKGNDEGS